MFHEALAKLVQTLDRMCTKDTHTAWVRWERLKYVIFQKFSCSCIAKEIKHASGENHIQRHKECEQFCRIYFLWLQVLEQRDCKVGEGGLTPAIQLVADAY